MGFDAFSLSFLSADAFCSSSVTSWGLPTIDTVRLSRLVLSCLRLVFGHRQLKQVWDATDTPTTPERDPLPPPEKTQDVITRAAWFPLVIFTFFWFFEYLNG